LQGVRGQLVTERRKGVAEIMLSHLRKIKGYKDPALVEGFEEEIQKISFQRTLKTILKYY
jgi:hypothetical protein